MGGSIGKLKKYETDSFSMPLLSPLYPCVPDPVKITSFSPLSARIAPSFAFPGTQAQDAQQPQIPVARCAAIRFRVRNSARTPLSLRSGSESVRNRNQPCLIV